MDFSQSGKRGGQNPGHSPLRVHPRAGTLVSKLLAVLALGVGTVAAPLAATIAQGQDKPAPRAEEPGEEYSIGSGDILQVFVWKEPELTRDVSVRLDGKITVPLIGDIQAAGRTPSQLTAEVEAALKRYISSPKVTLGVLDTKSARFYVLGQVTRPGDYPLPGRVSVLQGLALAGGFREFAKTDNIVIIRQEPGGERMQSFNYDELKSGKNLEQNVVLRPGDTIVVP